MKLIITLNKNKTLKKLKTHLKKLLTNKLIKTPNNDKRKRERDFFFQKINKNNNKQIKNELATAI
jgi:ATP-dependent RNA circularization protein (DNA/RNA ligase family)